MSLIKDVVVKLFFFQFIEVRGIGFEVSGVFPCELSVEVELSVGLGLNFHIHKAFIFVSFPEFWSNLDAGSRILIVQSNIPLELVIKS